uniref:Citrate synthase n=1 Tax=Odontella aurita TaxID=265563 RepID=A0A7S4HP64_9STRA
MNSTRPRPSSTEQAREVVRAGRRPARDAGNATLALPDGRSVDLPVREDARGHLFVDVRKLHATTGVCTYDEGFSSTAPCESAITYIDGARGELYYRGYPIEILAERSNVCDVIHLLVYGELPSPPQREAFLVRFRSESLLHEQLLNLFQGFKHDAHPMAIMCSAVAALSSFYPNPMADGRTRSDDDLGAAAISLIAKMPSLAAIAYKTSRGEPVVYPRPDLNYIQNFLHMTFSNPISPYVVDPIVERAMQVFFVLHADHEQNASTSTVRIAGSSRASPFVCASSGVASLWGPAHGGANEAVVRMLEDIGTVENIPAFVERAKDRSDPFRLMGFGHRVYKNFDPRSRIIRDECHRVLDKLGLDDPALRVAAALEEVALRDEYFVSRSLYPNVDFYSGIMLRAIGFPVSMYTVLFAVARSIGWMSQWKEMASEAVPKIGRPRQLYVGETRREFVPLEGRSTRAHDIEGLRSRL